MGMTISIAGYLSTIALAWITTKAPTFGQLVARQDVPQLDHLFFRTLRQIMSFLVLGSVAAMGGALVLNRYFPRLAARIISPQAFALILLGTFGSVLVQSLGIYLRSFKREPFLWQSVAVASFTVLFCLLTVRRMGSMGIALSYVACTGVFGSVSGWLIFRSWRRTIKQGDQTPQFVTRGE